MQCPPVFPEPSYSHVKILHDEYSEYFVQIVDGGVVESVFVVGVLVPDGRKRTGNDVKDRNSSSHERNVVVFDDTSGVFEIEKTRTFGFQ